MGPLALDFPLPRLKQPVSPFSFIVSDQGRTPLVFVIIFLVSLFFSTSPARFKNSVFQRCSPSRVCDERGQAAPLTAARR